MSYVCVSHQLVIGEYDQASAVQDRLEASRVDAAAVEAIERAKEGQHVERLLFEFSLHHRNQLVNRARSHPVSTDLTLAPMHHSR